MGEVLVVEFGEAVTVVDGFADHEHSSEREVVVVDDACEVFELTTVDALVRPCKVIASSYGGVGWIFL